MKSLAIVVPLLAVFLAGCAPHKYHPAPISPAATAAALYSRSLNDPALEIWMTQHAGFTASSWPLQVWNLESLTLAAFYFHPDLDVARANAATADAAITTAAMKPNPSVTLGGPKGMQQAISAFDFSLPIETAGKRGYRIAGATHLSTASRLQLAQVAWVVRSRLRMTLVDHLFAVQAAGLLRQETELRAKYVQLMAARYRAGEIPLPDLTTAKIDLTALSQSLSTAEGAVRTTHAALASAIGVSDAALGTTTLTWGDGGAPPAPGTLPSTAAQRLALQNRLDIRRALEQYEATQSALQLELARQYPDLNIGPGYSYEESTNYFSLVVSAVLPLRNRNQGPIAEAGAQRKAAGAALLALQSTVLADVDRSLAQYTAAFQTLEGATAAVSQLEEQERSADALLHSGEADRLTVVAAQLQTSVSKRARVDALHQTQLSLGLVEDALQRPLGVETNPVLPQNAPRP